MSLTAMIHIKPFCLPIKFYVSLKMKKKENVLEGVRSKSSASTLATEATPTTCMCIVYAWVNSLFWICMQLNSIQFDQIHRFCLFLFTIQTHIYLYTYSVGLSCLFLMLLLILFIRKYMLCFIYWNKYCVLYSVWEK